MLEQVQLALAATLREVYLVPIVCALAGLALIVLKFPAGSVQQLGASAARPAAQESAASRSAASSPRSRANASARP